MGHLLPSLPASATATVTFIALSGEFFSRLYSFPDYVPRMIDLLLATGWKGGYIFPIMFAGIALGMAANLLFPNVLIPATVAATLAGVLVTVMRAPMCAALFTLVLVDADTAPVVAVAVAVLVGALFAVILSLKEQETQQPVPVEPEPAHLGK